MPEGRGLLAQKGKAEDGADMSQRCRLPILFLLFVMLLASACATSIAKTEPTTTLSPTATPVLTPPPLTIKPAHPLTWTAHQLPPGLKLTPYNWDGPALAQSDGDTAYLCDLANGQAQVWATHDRAAHWSVAGSVPVASAVTSCDITVDVFQPRQALLRTYAPDGQCCAQETGEIRTYLTADGGATWSPRDAPTRRRQSLRVSPLWTASPMPSRLPGHIATVATATLPFS